MLTINYILAIIMFVLQIYILKHTYYVKIKGAKYSNLYEQYLQPLKVRVYIVLLMLVATIIPYFWILSLVIFWWYYIAKCTDPDIIWYNDYYTYWRLKDTFFMRTI